MALSAHEFAALRRAVLCELKDEANMVTTPEEERAHATFSGTYGGEYLAERQRLYRIAAVAVSSAVRRK